MYHRHIVYLVLVSIETVTSLPSKKAATISNWDSFENDLDGVINNWKDDISTSNIVATVGTEASSQWDNVKAVVTAGVNKSENLTSTTLSTVSSEAVEARNLAEVTYQKASKDASNAINSTENLVTSSWNSLTAFTSNATAAVGGFFSSSWSTICKWYTELEDEVKEAIAFVMNAFHIFVTVCVFLVVLYAVLKVRRAYLAVKRHVGVPDNV